MKQRKKWSILCITGVGCSGKTTLAHNLKSQLPNAHVIHQDDYFWPVDQTDKHVMIPEMSVANWEITSCVNFDQLLQDIETVLSTETALDEDSVLIVEGHLILNEPRICELASLKYCLMMTKDECWDRRRHKYYGPHDSRAYFEKCAWPQYQKRLAEMAQLNPDLHFINYTVDHSLLACQIMSALSLRCEARK